MSVEQQDEQIVQEIVGQVMNVTLDDGNVAELDHHNNSASKLNSTDEAIALEVSNLNACDVSTDYTDSEEANADKKDESLHSPKAEEKQQMSISAVLEGKNASYMVAANSFGDDSSMLEGKNTEVSAMTNGIGDESSLPHDFDNLVEEAKKEESPPPSPKEEEEDGKQKKDISMMEGEDRDEVPAMATANNNDGGEESDLPFNSTAGQNGGSAHEVSNLLDVSATDSVDNLDESTKTAISPYSPTPPKEEEKQQKDISMVEGNNEVRAMVTESGGEESDLAFNSAADVGQNDHNNDGNITTTTNNDMNSDTAANGHGGFSSSAQEGSKVEPKQQPLQKTNKTKLCSVL